MRQGDLHRLHRDGEADAVGEAAREALDVCGLAPRDAAVVSIEEAHEADTGAARLLDHAPSGGLRAAGAAGGHDETRASHSRDLG